MRYKPIAMLILAAAASEAAQTVGRTEIKYDPGRNVVFAMGIVNPDYQTQYYYKVSIVTYLNKPLQFGPVNSFGDEPWEAGVGSTYAELPAEPGEEYVAFSTFTGVIQHRTYEVVPGCFACYDWYDALGYLPIIGSGTSGPYEQGPDYTFETWVWLASITVVAVRTSEQTFNLGNASGRGRAPGDPKSFHVFAKAFLPPPWVYGPEPGCMFPSADGRPMVYKGDNRGFRWSGTYRMSSAIVLVPEAGLAISPSSATGDSKRYTEESIAADRVQLIDDAYLHDCYMLDDFGTASALGLGVYPWGDSIGKTAGAQFRGGAANGASGGWPSPEISWDLGVSVSKPSFGSASYVVAGTHDCFPAYEVYIGTHRVYEYMPSGYNPALNIAYCLSGAGAITLDPPRRGTVNTTPLRAGGLL